MISFFVGNQAGVVGELSRALEKRADTAGLESYLRALFELDSPTLEGAIAALKSAQVSDSAPPFVRAFAPWLRRLSELYPQDPGVLSSMLLNLVELAPGEAMFLPACSLHAYLDGVGLELMACSDNVLRGGLTSKHVDVSELFKVLVFASSPPEIQKPQEFVERGVKWQRFITPAEEFELSLLELHARDALDCSPEGPEIWLGLEGELELRAAEQTVRLSQGEQAFVFPPAQLLVSGTGKAARAALPR